MPDRFYPMPPHMNAIDDRIHVIRRRMQTLARRPQLRARGTRAARSRLLVPARKRDAVE
jgi:tetrahydromethanopterin S-methyltransferase subunit F